MNMESNVSAKNIIEQYPHKIVIPIEYLYGRRSIKIDIEMFSKTPVSSLQEEILRKILSYQIITHLKTSHSEYDSISSNSIIKVIIPSLEDNLEALKKISYATKEFFVDRYIAGILEVINSDEDLKKGILDKEYMQEQHYYSHYEDKMRLLMDIAKYSASRLLHSAMYYPSSKKEKDQDYNKYSFSIDGINISISYKELKQSTINNIEKKIRQMYANNLLHVLFPNFSSNKRDINIHLYKNQEGYYSSFYRLGVSYYRRNSEYSVHSTNGYNVPPQGKNGAINISSFFREGPLEEEDMLILLHEVTHSFQLMYYSKKESNSLPDDVDEKYNILHSIITEGIADVVSVGSYFEDGDNIQNYVNTQHSIFWLNDAYREINNLDANLFRMKYIENNKDNANYIPYFLRYSLILFLHYKHPSTLNEIISYFPSQNFSEDDYNKIDYAYNYIIDIIPEFLLWVKESLSQLILKYYDIATHERDSFLPFYFSIDDVHSKQEMKIDEYYILQKLEISPNSGKYRYYSWMSKFLSRLRKDGYKTFSDIYAHNFSNLNSISSLQQERYQSNYFASKIITSIDDKITMRVFSEKYLADEELSELKNRVRRILHANDYKENYINIFLLRNNKDIMNFNHYGFAGLSEYIHLENDIYNGIRKSKLPYTMAFNSSYQILYNSINEDYFSEIEEASLAYGITARIFSARYLSGEQFSKIIDVTKNQLSGYKSEIIVNVCFLANDQDATIFRYSKFANTPNTIIINKEYQVIYNNINRDTQSEYIFNFDHLYNKYMKGFSEVSGMKPSDINYEYESILLEIVPSFTFDLEEDRKVIERYLEAFKGSSEKDIKNTHIINTIWINHQIDVTIRYLQNIYSNNNIFANRINQISNCINFMRLEDRKLLIEICKSLTKEFDKDLIIVDKFIKQTTSHESYKERLFNHIKKLFLNQYTEGQISDDDKDLLFDVYNKITGIFYEDINMFSTTIRELTNREGSASFKKKLIHDFYQKYNITIVKETYLKRIDEKTKDHISSCDCSDDVLSELSYRIFDDNLNYTSLLKDLTEKFKEPINQEIINLAINNRIIFGNISRNKSYKEYFINTPKEYISSIKAESPGEGLLVYTPKNVKLESVAHNMASFKSEEIKDQTDTSLYNPYSPIPIIPSGN